MRRYKVSVSLQSSKIQTSTTLNDPNSYFGRRAEVGGQHAKIATPRSTFVARVDFCSKSDAPQNPLQARGTTADSALPGARHAVFGYLKIVEKNRCFLIPTRLVGPKSKSYSISRH